jgi:uncharacterized protein (PEP-CTERM system associated)
MATRNSATRIAVSIAFCSCFVTPALAQQTGSTITPVGTVPGQNLPGAAPLPRLGTQGASSTDGSSPAPAWTITPRIGLTETLSDNINLSSTNTQTGFISQLSPGVRIDARTARLKMFLDYSLNGLRYSTGSSSSQAQNLLNAFGTLEAIDNWLFLDFSGNISQQVINPFGVQAPSGIYNNNNLTETSTYRLSPFIKGQLGGSADYFLRYNVSATNYSDNSLSNVTLSQWIGQVRGNTRFQNLNWAIDGSQQNTDYSRGRDYDDGRLRGVLTYKLFPELSVSGSGGWETNNYQSINNEGQSTYGYGINWTPTERTQVSGFQEHRFFGNGYNVLLSHRFPLSSIRYTAIRDVSLLPNQFTSSGMGTVYDMYFDQFSNQIPDPVARAAYVTNLLNQLGVAPNAQAVSDYAAQRPRIQSSQQLTYVLYGARNSLTLIAARNENEALTVFGQNTNIAGQASRVTQQGVTVSFAHRLTPLTALNLLGSRMESQSGLTNALNTTMTTYQVGVSTRFGAKTAGSLNLRRSEFDSDTNPYTENALVGSITMFF